MDASSAPGERGQYSSLEPEPIDVIESWGLDFHEGQVLKYLARWRRKGGVEDLEKSKWFLERLINRETSKVHQDSPLPADGED